MKYNEQQCRFEKAFSEHRTSCSVQCTCGKTHFVAAKGHGDYPPGEMESLLKQSETSPDVIPEWEYDHIDAAWIDGRQIVVDCPCNGYKRYCDWIENHAEGLVVYLKDYLAAKSEKAKRTIAESSQLVNGLDVPAGGAAP